MGPILKTFFITFIYLLMSNMIVAADVSKGFEAYNNEDYETAYKEFLVEAEQGNMIAQTNLGIMYDNGQGVLQDYEEAVKWYRLAAEQGYADAQSNLGTMYEHGQGVPQDYEEAV